MMVDFGTPPMEIPIIIVYNGKDHYCSSRLKAETFKDGLDLIVEKLQDCVVKHNGEEFSFLNNCFIILFSFLPSSLQL